MFSLSPRRSLAICALLVVLSGCQSLDYYRQLGVGQWQLLAAREPVQTLLADPDTPPQLARQLRLSQQARDFASEHLHLPDNRSYRVYADLKRPFVVWNVFATDELSLAPIEHCFPIAGCVAYRGYYQLGRARGAAALMAQQGLDTYVAGVEAYSTLGWFADPLLNTMLRWSDERLVAVIFHELAHQQFYLQGDTAFNESYATFVEQQGLHQWRQQRGEQDATTDDQQRREFVERVLATRAELQTLYASPRSDAEKRAGKAAAFERLRHDYRVLRDTHWSGDRRYDAWINGPLNNAKLLPFGLYDQWVPAFAALFKRHGCQWPAFYQAVAQLGALPADARTAALEDLQHQPANVAASCQSNG